MSHGRVGRESYFPDEGETSRDWVTGRDSFHSEFPFTTVYRVTVISKSRWVEVEVRIFWVPLKSDEVRLDHVDYKGIIDGLGIQGSEKVHTEGLYDS